MIESKSLTFLNGGGDMGRRIRQFDWSATQLGSPETWQGNLRTLVQVMLTSRQPMFVAWGPERIMLYNDGYAPMCAHRHPSALGQPFHAVWSDIIDTVGPIMDAAYASAPTSMEDIAFTMPRNGKLVEAHFSFGYTPVHDEQDRVAGVFCSAIETTAEVQRAKSRTTELERLRQLLEQAPSFMAVVAGPNHVFELTNSSYLQLIGHRDVLGKPVREALPEVDGQGFFELLDNVFTTGEAYVGRALPISLQRAPGSQAEQRFVDFIYQPILSPEGAVTGIFAQGHDITDQKLAELAAASSEARFRSLAQSLPNHVWTALPDGYLNWFNDQMYIYSGAIPGRLDGEGWASIVHPEDLAAAVKAWREALSAGTQYKTECRLRGHDGAYRWHITRATPVRDQDNHVAYWVGTNTEIEDQKFAELALRESSVRLELALAAAQLGVWECKVRDGQFVDLRADETASHLLGGTPGKPVSFKEFADRIHPEDRLALLQVARKTLDTDSDGTLDFEYRITPQEDERERWVHARARAIFGTRLIGTVRDISERKASEDTQRVLGAELQHRIKNTLAMVTSIASQTLKGDDILERRQAFSARIEALAKAHDLLTSHTWKSSPIRTVVETALSPHQPGPDRFVLDGVGLSLTAKQALSMALTIHELATNAAKYGALSGPEGKVHIRWGFENVHQGERQFVFSWTETGGPPVVEPSRKGFGSRLITRALAADFSGQVRIEYAPAGILCILVSPASSVQAETFSVNTTEAKGT